RNDSKMRSQAEKGRLFKERHAKPGILLLPNPWDAGTAKLLASLGFDALATTSLGMSNALGRVDGQGSVSRVELLENCPRTVMGTVRLGSPKQASGSCGIQSLAEAPRVAPLAGPSAAAAALRRQQL